MNIKIIKEDITKIDVDAIVNAANSTLLGGGGVDGAIHRAAGIELYNECKTLGGCKTGEAKITKGYHLKAKFVIHTVGPIWNGGKHQEEMFLKNCYLNSLSLAEENNITSIAFPNISTGVYRFPKLPAAEIAINSVLEYRNLNPNSTIKQVYFVCFDEENHSIYEKFLRKKGTL